MSRPVVRNLLILCGFFLLLWLGIEYLLPLSMPFVIGTLLALAAEPGVSFASGRLKLPRWASAGISVSVTVLLVLSLLVLLGSFALRELRSLSFLLPNLWETARQGLNNLEGTLMGAVDGAPAGIQPMLRQSVGNLFGSGSTLLTQLAGTIPGVLSTLLSRVPNSALTTATALISAYMISARLPGIRQWLRTRLPEVLYSQYLPALKRLRGAAFGWLKAQLKLSGVSFGILTVGFLLLRIPYAPAWALLIAMVDALPLLGTGVVLLPWAAVSLLQGRYWLGAGLAGIYAAAALTRSVLEPRLIGRQLGLDPLITLAALYVGYRFWGLLGMVLAPVFVLFLGEITQIHKKTPG